MVKAKTYGNKIYQYAMPPLPEDFPLPPLPPIPVKRLKDIALTHTSYYGITKENHDLDTAKYLHINDYEKREFLGDRILSLCVDMMVHEVFPGMRQGVASMMHDHMVRNEFLAQLADKYGLTERLRTSPSAGYSVKMQNKVRGSIFESYIAGVFYAHLEGEEGGPRCNNGDKATSPKPAANVHQPGVTKPESTEGLRTADKASTVTPASCAREGNGPNSTPAIPASEHRPSPIRKRTYGDALDHTCKWLRPLFLPILDHALQAKQDYQRRLEADEEEAEQTEEVKKVKKEEMEAGGAAAALNVYCQHTFGTLPVYTCARDRDDPRAWKITCTVTTGDGEVFFGEGVKKTEKMAKSLATHQVGLRMKLWK